MRLALGVRAAVLAAPVFLLCACAADRGPREEIEPATARERVDQAAAQVERGELLEAAQALSDLWATSNLVPELRLEVDQLLERATDRLVQTYEVPDGDPGTLKGLARLDLPRRLQARLAVAEARLRLSQGQRVKAYRVIKAIDETHPTHEERAAAGAVVAEAGLDMARDPGRYMLFFRYRNRSVELLEYLVLRYPSEPRCPEAYRMLAEIYEEQGELDLAVERHEDLVLYHPASAWSVSSELAIPRLRLAAIDRADYDRGSVIRAEGEVEAWMARHPEDPLVPEAAALRALCLERLCESDLGIAAFYAKLERRQGLELHADRALAVALEAGDTRREERARELLLRASELREREASSLLEKLEPPPADLEPASGDPVVETPE